MKYVFVSSTFRDMQAERDALQNVVLPRLRKTASNYGDDVYFCDLRWGINTSKLESLAADEKILFSCMNEIDRCRPFMIVMLGERYGTSFDVEFIQRIARSRKGYHLLPRNCNKESVTEFEIEYGALSTPESICHTIFLLRDPIEGAPDYYRSDGKDDEERAKNAAMLAELKDKITLAAEENGARVIRYSLGYDKKSQKLTGIDNFIELVSKAMSEMLKPEWDQISALPEHKINRILHGRAASNYANQFVGRTELLEDCRKKLEGGRTVLKITGPTGSGKSVLFSKLFVYMKDLGYNVCPFVWQDSLKGDVYMSRLKHWIRYVEDELGVEHENVEDIDDEYDKYDPYEERLSHLLTLYDKSDLPLLILGDDTPYSGKHWHYEKYEKMKTKKICFVFSYRCDNDENFPDFKPIKDHIYLGNYPLSGRVLLEAAVKASGKELHPLVVDKILERYGSANPNCLTLLIQRLMIMDENDFRSSDAQSSEFDPSVAAQLRLLDTISLEFDQMIRLAVKVAADRFGKEQIDATIRLLCCVPGGLRRVDIRNIVKAAIGEWDEECFSRLVCLLPSVIIEHMDGTIGIKSKEIREVLTVGDERDYDIIELAVEYFEGFYRDLNVRFEVLFDLYDRLFDYAILRENAELARKILMSTMSLTVEYFYISRSSVHSFTYDTMLSIFSRYEKIWRLEGKILGEDIEFCYKNYMRLNEDYEGLPLLSFSYTFVHLVKIAVSLSVELGQSSDTVKPYLDKVSVDGVFYHSWEYHSHRDNISLCRLYEKDDTPESTVLLGEAIKATKSNFKRIYDSSRRDSDYWWYKSMLSGIEGNYFAKIGDSAKARKSYRKSLKKLKVRLFVNLSRRRILWGVMGDTLKPVFEMLGIGGYVYPDSILKSDDESRSDRQKHVIEHLRSARVYECRFERNVATVFYKMALDKASFVLDEDNPDAYTKWMYAVCHQSYARVCDMLQSDRVRDDRIVTSEVVMHYIKALDTLRDVEKTTKCPMIDAFTAIIYYSLGSLPDSTIDRFELLRKAEKIIDDLINKTGMLVFHLIKLSIKYELKKVTE